MIGVPVLFEPCPDAAHVTLFVPMPVRPFPTTVPLPAIGLAQALPMAEVGLLGTSVQTWLAGVTVVPGFQPAVQVIDSPGSVDSASPVIRFQLVAVVPPLPRTLMLVIVIVLV